jgi:hypothetical protein
VRPSADFSLKIGAFDGKLAAFNRIEVGLSDVSAAEFLASCHRSQGWSKR